MRTNDERSIPIPARRIFIAPRLRLNTDAFSSALVETDEHAVLKCRIDGVWIFRIYLRTKTIAAICDKPVGVGDTRSTARARWATKAEIILCAAIDVVKRLSVVGGDVVKLRYGKVLFEVPGLTSIETFVNATVATNEIVVRVLWIDPDIVIVYVFISLAEAANSAAAIIRHHQKHVHDVDALDVFRIRDDTGVVHRSRIKFIAPFPTTTAIARAKDSATAISSFDSRIDYV